MRKRKKPSMDFFDEFFRNRRQLGTPFQSSKYLVRTVAREVVGFNVVELGAGHGPITRGILAYHPEVNLTAFEINSRLLEHLAEIQDPRLTIVRESAENFPEYVDDLASIHCIVSGLPLTSMSRPLVAKILESSRNSRYIQYKYFPEKKLLETYFDHVSARVVWRNVPPALVYVCHNNGSNGDSSSFHS